MRRTLPLPPRAVQRADDEREQRHENHHEYLRSVHAPTLARASDNPRVRRAGAAAAV
ncbi:hypothetical protein GCM10028789_21050 [Sinomonas halotolerans]